MIPKALREELGLVPGDEVAFWREGDHVAVRPARSHRALKGRFVGRPLTAALERDRAEEMHREAASDDRA